MRLKYLLPSLLYIAPTLSDDTLHLCISEWPPHEFTDSKINKITGSTVSLVEKTLTKIGKKFDIESLPFERCTAMVKSGDKQGVFSLSKNPERETDFTFASVPLKAVGYHVAVLTENVSKIENEWKASKDLKKLGAALGKDIGSPQGFSATKKAIDAGASVDASATDDETNFQKLLGGRVGAILIEPSVFENLKAKLGSSTVTMLDPAFVEPKDYFVAFTKAPSFDTAFPGAFSKALEEVKKG